MTERFQITSPLGEFLDDPRRASHLRHTYVDLIRQRVYQMAEGYEDCNDANHLRVDPAGDPPICASCVCGSSNCAPCAACRNFLAHEFPGDGIDSNCDGKDTGWGHSHWVVTPSGDGIETSGGGDSCFIATASFGTEMSGQIDVLRRFRDRYLVIGEEGREFVEAYYRISPPIAQYIAGNGWLRALVRTLLLPVVGFVSLFV